MAAAKTEVAPRVSFEARDMAGGRVRLQWWLEMLEVQVFGFTTDQVDRYVPQALTKMRANVRARSCGSSVHHHVAWQP